MECVRSGKVVRKSGSTRLVRNILGETVLCEQFCAKLFCANNFVRTMFVVCLCWSCLCCLCFPIFKILEFENKTTKTQKKTRPTQKHNKYGAHKIVRTNKCCTKCFAQHVSHKMFRTTFSSNFARAHKFQSS